MLAARFIKAFAVELDLRGEEQSSLALPARLVEQTVVPGDPSRSRLATHGLLLQRGLVDRDPFRCAEV